MTRVIDYQSTSLITYDWITYVMCMFCISVGNDKYKYKTGTNSIIHWIAQKSGLLAYFHWGRVGA